MACGDDPSTLEYVAVVGDGFDNIEVVGGGDDGFHSSSPAHEKVDYLALAFGIECGGGFVHEQHFWVKYEDRGEGDAFFFAAGESVRGAVFEVGDFHEVEHVGDSAADVVVGPAELERAEGYFVEDGWVEELDIGVLEDECNAAAKCEGVRFVLEVFFGEGFAKGADAAAGGEVESVEQSQEGGFAGAVCAEDGDAATFVDGEADGVERGDVAGVVVGDVLQFEDRFLHVGSL